MKNIIVKIALLGVTLIAMSACCNKGGNTADAVLDNIHSRKSVRQYTSEPVSEEQVETMLRAAMAAPSAVNFQPWRFVVVTERAKLDAMAEILPYAKMLKQSPLAIVVCGETVWMGGNENPYWQQDCAAATQNLLLAAEALGLGAVWTGVYPNAELYTRLTTSSVFLLPSSRSARSLSDILQATSSQKTNGNRKTSITGNGKRQKSRVFYRSLKVFQHI